jgi:phosphoribosylformylglycinamidine cyclo-ligase
MGFAKDIHFVKNNMFKTPSLLKLIKDAYDTDWKEMYKVFNMGHRMEIYVPKAVADSIISISKSFGVDAQIIGHCETNEGNKVTIRSEHGTFEYVDGEL